MKLSLRCIVALAAFSVVSLASAASPNVFTTLVEAQEIQVKSTVLPLSATSSLVVTPCSGCAPKSYAPTATTQYFINSTAVTLQDLRAAVSDKPDLILTVAVESKTGNLVSITADLPKAFAPAARRR